MLEELRLRLQYPSQLLRQAVAFISEFLVGILKFHGPSKFCVKLRSEAANFRLQLRAAGSNSPVLLLSELGLEFLLHKIAYLLSLNPHSLILRLQLFDLGAMVALQTRSEVAVLKLLRQQLLVLCFQQIAKPLLHMLALPREFPVLLLQRSCVGECHLLLLHLHSSNPLKQVHVHYTHAPLPFLASGCTALPAPSEFDVRLTEVAPQLVAKLVNKLVPAVQTSEQFTVRHLAHPQFVLVLPKAGLQVADVVLQGGYIIRGEVPKVLHLLVSRQSLQQLLQCSIHIVSHCSKECGLQLLASPCAPPLQLLSLRDDCVDLAQHPLMHPADIGVQVLSPLIRRRRRGAHPCF
eukprot:Hpha_TRINITY_DN8096_c0_g1::TRINITY_DN8096_c0_g1_i2::g.140153::m.140153